MKKQNVKLAVALLALSCAAVCVGAGTVTADNSCPTTVTASAESVSYKVYSLTFTGGSATEINAYPNDGSGKPAGDWDSVYTLQSGEGFKLNGEEVTATLKQPNDFYIALTATVNTGDILTVEGTFYNEAKDTQFVFNKCALKWNGTAWETHTIVTEYNLGALKFNMMQPNADNMAYFHRADDQAFPAIADESTLWNSPFTYEKGAITLNGEPVNVVVKFPNAAFFEFSLFPSEGDELVIGGEFYNQTFGAKYIIAESTFVWNGTVWAAKGEEPKTYELGELTFHVNSMPHGAAGGINNNLYLQRADEQALPIENWKYFFVAENQDCFKVNGVAATLFEMKSTDAGLFLSFAALEAGDVVTIGGTFKSEALLMTYVIEESSFVWNGSSWEAYVDYTEHELGALMFVSFEGGYLNMANFAPINGEAIPIVSTENDVNWTTEFIYTSGSITLNGNAIRPIVKFPHDMFIDGSIPNAGDKLVIGGVFYSPTLAVKYIVTETAFTFNGEVWMSELDVVKAEAKAALNEYNASFVEADYYEAEWASMATIVAEGAAAIDGAATAEAVATALATAKAAMDDVATKAETDAMIDTWKAEAKAELAAYKNEADYRAAQWAELQAIVATAETEIDACATTTEMSAVVENAKIKMDAVKTADVVAAEEAVVTAAKAELTAYKTESNYDAEGWAAIQAIITEANTALDNAIGNEEAIAAIVADAKADMDEVLTAEEAAAVALAAAKEAAITEVQAYYGALDYSNYSDEALATINGYVADVMAAIEGAITADEATAAVAQFKTNVAGVATLNPSTSDSATEEKKSSGCGSALAGSLAVSVALAAAVAVVLKKKED